MISRTERTTRGAGGLSSFSASPFFFDNPRCSVVAALCSSSVAAGVELAGTGLLLAALPALRLTEPEPEPEPVVDFLPCLISLSVLSAFALATSSFFRSASALSSRPLVLAPGPPELGRRRETLPPAPAPPLAPADESRPLDRLPLRLTERASASAWRRADASLGRGRLDARGDLAFPLGVEVMVGIGIELSPPKMLIISSLEIFFSPAASSAATDATAVAVVAASAGVAAAAAAAAAAAGLGRVVLPVVLPLAVGRPAGRTFAAPAAPTLEADAAPTRAVGVGRERLLLRLPGLSWLRERLAGCSTRCGPFIAVFSRAEIVRLPGLRPSRCLSSKRSAIACMRSTFAFRSEVAAPPPPPRRPTDPVRAFRISFAVPLIPCAKEGCLTSRETLPWSVSCGRWVMKPSTNFAEEAA